MKSMTGYGEGGRRNEKAEVYLQMRTVNHRFLNIEVTLPLDAPLRWEKKIKSYIEEKIERGRITVYVRIRRKESSLKVIVNQELVSRYHQALSQLSDKLGLGGKIKLSHLLSLPDIIKLDSEEEGGIDDLLNKALTKALKEVLYMREREGERHHRNIQNCVRKIEDNLLNIEKQAPLVRENHQKRIREELIKLLKEEDRGEVADEISLLVNRSDINEELVRFHSHLDQFKRTIKQGTPMGKKLEFILQELKREANTIGAKANSFDISSFVIQIKEEMEKIREQVQNIE